MALFSRQVKYEVQFSDEQQTTNYQLSTANSMIIDFIPEIINANNPCSLLLIPLS